MEALKFCPRCGHEVEANANFCTYCGTALKFSEALANSEDSPEKPTASALKQVRWRWVIACISIVFILVIIDRFVISYIYRGPIATGEGIPFLIVAWSVILMIFLGSFITALISPGKTITEPAMACAIIVVFISLLQRNPDGLIFGWILPFFLGLFVLSWENFYQVKLKIEIS